MAIKIFPRKALGLIVLSILDENPEGLTGYAIVKEIEQKFGLHRKISPGTIYPKLDRLRDKGFISEEGNVYKILPEGKERLTQKIPDILENSFEFMPKFLKVLMQPLPFCHQDLVSDAGFIESISKLEYYRERLIHLREKIEERRNAELTAIDERIHFLEEKIEKIQEEKKSWTQITIDKEDDEKE